MSIIAFLILKLIVFRISYGDDAIPKAAEADYKSTVVKSKPFIPPEYKNFEDKPHQLPLFLKEKLYKTVKSRKSDATVQEDSNLNPPVDQLAESNMHTQSRGEFLPSLPSYRNAKQHGISVKDFGRSTLGFGTPIRAGELPDFPYFSPKARQQMKSDSVPVLMSNVFLTGGINPEGLAPQDEAAVEYIVSEYHSKTRAKPPTAKTGDYDVRTQTNSRSRLTKTAMTMSLARQNEKKKEWEEVLYKNGPKQGVDKFGTKLKATVGHLKTEREVKRKKVLSLLKTKNFNLFRPNTINNLHLLKDALLKE